MKAVHYFQRFSQPENVSTNNTLLLFSRMYQYSPFKFKVFINELLGDSDINAGIIFKQQESNYNSIPDGSISQESFKIVIETKLYNSFSVKQLIKHCNSFGDSNLKILLSLSPGIIQNTEILSNLKKYNQDNNVNVRHVHVTFKQIIESSRNVIDASDFEFKQIIDDYEEYCFDSGLIDESESWMRAVTCGWSLDENFKFNLYYDPATRGYSAHGYIGVYASKSIRGIGKINNIITADKINNKLKIYESVKDVTIDEENRILSAIQAAYDNNGWKIDKGHKFFLVDNFYKTNFRKKSKFPLQGTKFFNLLDTLNLDKLPDTKKIAELLNEPTW